MGQLTAAKNARNYQVGCDLLQKDVDERLKVSIWSKNVTLRQNALQYDTLGFSDSNKD